MKRIICLLILTLYITSCNKVFKDDTQNVLVINSQDDLRNALSGLYYRFGNSVVGDSESMISSVSFINADDASVISDLSWNTDINNNIINISEIFNINGPFIIPAFEFLWSSSFQTVICANDILSKSAKINQDKPEIRNLLGEVYFIRAYTYFRLVRYFGQVPLIDNVNVNFTMNKASFSELYNFITSDLQTAINMLPASNNLARYQSVTPHRGTAKALLAEVYLTMGGYPLNQSNMYSQAATMAKEVIDSALFFGYNLLPDFSNLWDGKQEINNETVFALYFEDQQNYSNIAYGGLYMPYTWKNTPYIKPGIKFYNHFPSNYRKSITYRTSSSIDINGNGYYDTISLPSNINALSLSVIFKKYNTPFTNMYLDGLKGRVIYLLRYANTLLTFAEAKARSGNIDASAYDAINQVRRRANNVDINTPSNFDLPLGLTSQQFADTVVWERAWELCGEPEIRSFDLLRLGMLGQLPNLKFPGQGQTKEVLTNPETHFFPIPEVDIKLNHNMN